MAEEVDEEEFRREFGEGNVDWCWAVVEWTQAKVLKDRADLKAAAGEHLVPMPEPGTDAAIMLRAVVLMRGERDEAIRERDEARKLAENFDRFGRQIRDLRAMIMANEEALRRMEAIRERDEARSTLEDLCDATPLPWETNE